MYYRVVSSPKSLSDISRIRDIREKYTKEQLQIQRSVLGKVSSVSIQKGGNRLINGKNNFLLLTVD